MLKEKLGLTNQSSKCLFLRFLFYNCFPSLHFLHNKLSLAHYLLILLGPLRHLDLIESNSLEIVVGKELPDEFFEFFRKT